MHLIAEQCTQLYAVALQREIRKVIDREHPRATSNEVYQITKEEIEKFTINDQKFHFTSIKNQLGGYRWFFVCEQCQRRVSKLFIPPTRFPNVVHRYLCKKCHNIKNHSTLHANNNIYRKVLNPLKKLRRIEDKLNKRLSPAKISYYLDLYDKIEKEMKASAEYRLYSFKKRRGMKILG
jgi:hypothetical protein